MKKAFKIGALLGGILGFSIAVGMDLIMGGTIGFGSGGWTDAVVNDLNLLFDGGFKSGDLIVVICVFLAISFVVLISTLLGGVFLSLLVGFFEFMTKRK